MFGEKYFLGTYDLKVDKKGMIRIPKVFDIDYDKDKLIFIKKEDFIEIVNPKVLINDIIEQFDIIKNKYPTIKNQKKELIKLSKRVKETTIPVTLKYYKDRGYLIDVKDLFLSVFGTLDNLVILGTYDRITIMTSEKNKEMFEKYKLPSILW